MKTRKDNKGNSSSPLHRGCIFEVLCCCLQHQGIWTIFKSDTTLRSHLVQTIKTRRCHLQDPMWMWQCISAKQGDQCIKDKGTWQRHQFSRTVVSEHANKMGHIPIWSKVKFIDHDSTGTHVRWQINEAIHIRLHLNNINRNSGIKIAEAWIPMIKQYNSQSMRTYEGKPSNNWNNNEDRNAPMAVNQLATNSDM